MFRRVALVIGLLAGIIPTLAHAQQSIDTGKTPADIFAIDCATCHKGARGLAHGKSSSELASFLAEHYTSSKDQAAALAAYVMGAGGGDAAPAQARGPKTSPDHPAAAAAAEPQKPTPAGRPGKPTGKPEEAPSATAKLQPEEDKKPPATAPGRQPAAATAAHNRRNGPEPVQPPTAAVTEPVSPGAPAQETSAPAVPTQSAAAPANTDSGESAPVPRDDIPD